jgi:3-phenylpropionate/trans-cinnamate dioxygenase ferredoxin subunit
MPWIDACATDAVDQEDLIRWDHAGKTYAIYHSPDGEVLLHRRQMHA